MTKQIVARISDELHLKVKLKAVREGKSITQIISELLEEWVSDEEDQPGL